MNDLGLQKVRAFCRECGCDIGEVIASEMSLVDLDAEKPGEQTATHLQLVCDGCAEEIKLTAKRNEDIRRAASMAKELNPVYEAAGLDDDFINWNRTLGNNDLLARAGGCSYGTGMFIAGHTGNCKTRVVQTGAAKMIRDQYKFGKNYVVKFEVYGLLLDELRGLAMSDAAGLTRRVNGLINCDLLIIDEFASKDGETLFGLEQMFNIIDGRYRKKKKMWFTSNYPLTECIHRLDKKVIAEYGEEDRGQKIIRRIAERCEVVPAVVNASEPLEAAS